MPSGLPSDSGEPAGESVRAEYTVTFTAPKISQIFPPNCEGVGRLHVKAIGSAPSVVKTGGHLKLFLVEPGDIADLFAPRKRTAHKGDFGHVLVIAGSRSKPGAAIMAGASALRAGAGLVTVATAAGAATAVVGHTPELMTEPAAELEDGSMGESSFCPGWLNRKTVVAVGPGIGVTPSNQELVRRVIREAKVPVVIDADGLTAMASAGEEDWGVRSPLLVMTPHPGEMGRLTGLSVAEVEHRRVEIARHFAARRNCCLVLKGYRTLIALPDGRVLVNPTGTPAMASGGSGDILTGLIAGFLAQFPDKPVDIVVAAAVYIHGLAGELAAQARGELSTIATDLLTSLPQAIAAVRESV
jgi:NAD(P)H-hydrate epimerase